MIAHLRHRGPDGEGCHIDGGVAFGHLRLAVVEPSGGAQPRIEADGRALVYNGEVYGFSALAEDLRSQGVTLRDRSDTEVLFALLDRDGPEATVCLIDGMFAFAYRDRAGRIWLARDRFGEKPLYYAVVDGELHFASELAALRAHPRVAALPWDAAALRRFLLFQYVPGGDSGIEGVRQLPPGTLLRFDAGKTDTIRYWNHAAVADPSAAEPDLESAADRLDVLFDRAVAERLIADVPVGLFLSGGLDSSLVAAYARRHAHRLKSFGVGFPDASYDEGAHAEALARRLGLDHRTILCDDRTLEGSFDAILGGLDHLLGDPSILPTYVLCREARREVTVAVGGDGADELFLGYPNFQARRHAGAMARIPASWGRYLRGALSGLPVSGGYMNLPFKLRQLSYGFGNNPDAQSLLWMSGLGPEERGEIWPDERLESDLRNAVQAAARDHWGPDPSDGVERLCRLFLRGYLPDAILAKVDRASMLSSLEVRAPYLARDVAEFALTLDTRSKLSGSTGKRVMRVLARRHLPPDVASRPKHGFAPPLARLFRSGLRGRARAAILESGGPLAGVLNRRALESMLDEHDRGVRDHGRRIWTLCVLLAVTSRI
jgi:asparagine synthase (glutamine-hydrolysing)